MSALGHSSAFILVLFILLVIVLASCWCF
ncbi:YjcZ family sporulation protein [Paenibacillus sp. HJGM_3]